MITGFGTLGITGSGGSGGTNDPDVTTYAAAVAAAGGYLPTNQVTALNIFVSALKNLDVWSRITEIGLFLGGNLASAAVKLKYPVASTCVLNGFAAGDLTSVGLTSDGSTKWVDTQTTVNQLTTDGSMGMGVFLTAECTQSTFCNLMGTNAGGNPQVVLRWNAIATQAEVLMNGIGALSATNTKVRGILPVGLIAGQRTGNNLNLYQGGLIAGGANSTFTYAGSNSSLGVFSGVGGESKVAMTAGMYFMSNGAMTDISYRAFTNACNILMVDLRRVVANTRTLNYVPIIGQSLAAGANGEPPISTTQPYTNNCVESGARGNLANPTPSYWQDFGVGCNAGGLIPMVEIERETIASGAANTVAKLARADGLGISQDLLVQNFGLGATAYAGLKKGTTPYADNIDTSTFTPIAGQMVATNPMHVAACWAIHGESDMLSTTYGADIRQWQVDYETDYKAITGQSGTIPIFHSQPSCWTAVANVNSATGIAPYQILTEYETNPTKTILVGPKYFLTYSGADGVHLINTSYTKLGEYYGKAHYQHVVKGIQWSPLRPTNITRSGAVITVTFSGNVGNLQFDTTNVTDPSGAAATKGFEYTDSAGGSIYTRIASVTITTPNVVVITLTADPGANTGKTLRYAYTGTAGNNAGPTTGPRGCLKDSDTTVGISGAALPNWCVHFSKSLT